MPTLRCTSQCQASFRARKTPALSLDCSLPQEPSVCSRRGHFDRISMSWPQSRAAASPASSYKQARPLRGRCRCLLTHAGVLLAPGLSSQSPRDLKRGCGSIVMSRCWQSFFTSKPPRGPPGHSKSRQLREIAVQAYQIDDTQPPQRRNSATMHAAVLAAMVLIQLSQLLHAGGAMQFLSVSSL